MVGFGGSATSCRAVGLPRTPEGRDFIMPHTGHSGQAGKEMAWFSGRRLPAKWAPFMTSFLLSVFMCAFVSLVATLKGSGLSSDLLGKWLGAWLVSWLLAFPVVLVIMPVVRKSVAIICRPS